jgi:hypothetical protein
VLSRRPLSDAPSMARSALLCGALCIAFLACSASVAAARTTHADAPRKVVLIAGAKSEGLGRHDYPNAIRALARLLKSSPELQSAPGVDIESHPDGWPSDAALDAALAGFRTQSRGRQRAAWMASDAG